MAPATTDSLCSQPMTDPLPPSLPVTPAAAATWSTRRRFVFRCGAALFAVQMAMSLLDVSDATRAWTAAASAAVHHLAAGVAPTMANAWRELASRSDGHATLLNLLGMAGLAIGIAGLWSLVDRRRVDHTRLAGALRITLRYLVGVVMSVYGGIKVVNMQFPPPTVAELLQPLGSRTAMGLLWNFMGISPAYTAFAGISEVVGAALLFWRRTTTLGSLVLCGVLANVVAMNFAYDVPVKQGSAMLLVAVIALASRDAQRVFSLLVLGRPTTPAMEPAFQAGPWLSRARGVMKPLVVLLAIAAPPIAAHFVREAMHAPAPLHGLYEVQRFLRDSAEVPPLTTEVMRWRRLVIGERGGALLQYMDDRFVSLRLSVDQAQHTLTLTGVGANSWTFAYEARPGGVLRLQGQEANSIQEVLLQRQATSPQFRLLGVEHHR